MTEDKKWSVIESITDMAQALVQAKRELKESVEAASWAQSASDRVFQLVESVGEAERKLRQLMDLLDEEVRP